MKLQCWKCGEPLRELRPPYSRYEECSTCKADIHVCFMCKEFDENVADACREDRAEFVLDKDKANFCDYFKPRPGAHQKSNSAEAEAAKAKLAELFGESVDTNTESPSATVKSEADRALAELQRLFGDDKDKPQ